MAEKSYLRDMKCAIYGAGSLGTVMGAWLTKNGVDIQLVNRNRAHVEALRQSGARITGTVSMTVPVKAVFPDEMDDDYDCIFLMTKQLHNREVVTDLKGKLSPEGVIVTLQNGLPEPLIASVIGPERTLGCIVEWGAEMTGPGECRLSSEPDGLSFHMGRSPEVDAAKFNGVKAILEKMCPVVVETDMTGARFVKLLINATFSGIGTVMGGTFGDVVSCPEGREVAVCTMKECIDVCRALNIIIPKVQGKDITGLFYWRGRIKKAFAKLILPIALRKHRDIVPSMLQDLCKGKPCEIDAINGVFCESGRKAGVPTPFNDLIVSIVKSEQDGSVPVCRKNLDRFRGLLGR